MTMESEDQVTARSEILTALETVRTELREGRPVAVDTLSMLLNAMHEYLRAEEAVAAVDEE